MRGGHGHRRSRAYCARARPRRRRDGDRSQMMKGCFLATFNVRSKRPRVLCRSCDRYVYCRLQKYQKRTPSVSRARDAERFVVYAPAVAFLARRRRARARAASRGAPLPFVFRSGVALRARPANGERRARAARGAHAPLAGVRDGIRFRTRVFFFFFGSVGSVLTSSSCARGSSATRSAGPSEFPFFEHSVSNTRPFEKGGGGG